MGSLQQAAAYCRKLTERSRSNFYYAFLFLPRERREALYAVYAYCRLVDDVVDEDASVEHKLAGLDKWRRELDLIFGGPSAGEPEHPVASKLKWASERFGIRREDAEAIIDGCAMDIEKARYANWEELRTYCYRVASAVGLMCIEIFGYSSPRARDYAIDLGIALQLTNILRDVREDAARGRIYLPLEDLQAFGVAEEDLAQGRRTEGMQRLLRYSAARARSHYLRARAAIGTAEKRQLVIAEIMGDIYYELLEEIEKSGFDVFGEKTVLPRVRKMAIALRDVAGAYAGNLAAALRTALPLT
jgi:phytoene synthase